MGNFGNQSPEARKYLESRYKFDAIDYYKTDLEWFSLGFVMLVINITGLNYVLAIHSGKIRWINAQGVLVNDDSYGRGEIYQLYLLVAGRFAQLVIMSTMRNVYREFIAKKHFLWLFIILIYIVEFVTHRVLQDKLTHIAFSCIVTDFIMAVMSYVYYIFKVKMDEKDREEADRKRGNLQLHRN